MEQQQLEQENFPDLFEIDIDEFLTLIKNGISLDQVYILQKYNEGEDITLLDDSSKLAAWRISLIRKGFLTQENKVTELGKQLLRAGDAWDIKDKMKSAKKELKESIKTIKSDFDKWWECFPSTDEIKEKNLPVTRGLKTEKDKCKEIFCGLVDRGEYTAEQIIKATTFDIQNRRNQSKSVDNKLKFLHNSAKYLKDGDFIPFIGMTAKIANPSIKGGEIII